MFIWKIRELEYIETLGTLQKVVKNIHWWVEAHDGPDMGYNWGNIQLDVENIQNFIPWESLTEEQAISWVKNTLDQLFPGGHSAEEEAAANMLAQRNPLYRRGLGVPW